MTKPVRIQRKRTKGYNMQEHSRSINGLPAISVCRPGKYGNWLIPRKSEKQHIVDEIVYEWWVFNRLTGENGCLCDTKETAIKECVDLFRIHANSVIRAENIRQLRNHNLACFCKEGDPCHGDVLLELAND